MNAENQMTWDIYTKLLTTMPMDTTFQRITSNEGYGESRYPEVEKIYERAVVAVKIFCKHAVR